ncbi:hypothetical protein BDP27DRAFT_1406327 [Rhodocollybia butyracea]|uniref:Uncharacterized protein n=1 Tax=Rhodocollybia butyracea TaxID=206335 RepID=A0A9P5U041_9AGAR|nr:hypothetical protein BDP27DRAFT_1406327 [Rhodocollybia butyracea]
MAICEMTTIPNQQSIAAIIAESALYGAYTVFMIIAIQRLILNNLDENAFVFAQTAIFTFLFVIGDAVVVWRACAILQYEWRVIWIPLLLLTSTLFMAFFYLGCMGLNDWRILENQAQVCANGQLAGYALSITTNSVATFLVAYKAWVHRKSMEGLLGARIRKSRAANILTLLIESGLIYLVIWASKGWVYNSSLGQKTIAAQFANTIMNAAGNQIAGLYPTIVIVIINQDEDPRPEWGASLGNMPPSRISQQGPNSIPRTHNGTQNIIGANVISRAGTCDLEEGLSRDAASNSTSPSTASLKERS